MEKFDKLIFYNKRKGKIISKYYIVSDGNDLPLETFLDLGYEILSIHKSKYINCSLLHHNFLFTVVKYSDKQEEISCVRKRNVFKNLLNVLREKR